MWRHLSSVSCLGIIFLLWPGSWRVPWWGKVFVLVRRCSAQHKDSLRDTEEEVARILTGVHSGLLVTNCNWMPADWPRTLCLLACAWWKHILTFSLKQISSLLLTGSPLCAWISMGHRQFLLIRLANVCLPEYSMGHRQFLLIRLANVCLPESVWDADYSYW